jgi:hypothetical protein
VRRAAWNVLHEMRDTDSVRYRELFANLVPVDALPQEVYSDGQLEVIYGAVRRGLAPLRPSKPRQMCSQRVPSNLATTDVLP